MEDSPISSAEAQYQKYDKLLQDVQDGLKMNRRGFIVSATGLAVGLGLGAWALHEGLNQEVCVSDESMAKQGGVVIGAEKIAKLDASVSEEETQLINEETNTLNNMRLQQKECLDKNKEKDDKAGKILIGGIIFGSVGTVALGYFSSDMLSYKKNRRSEQNLKEEVTIWSTGVENERLNKAISSQTELHSE